MWYGGISVSPLICYVVEMKNYLVLLGEDTQCRKSTAYITHYLNYFANDMAARYICLLANPN